MTKLLVSTKEDGITVSSRLNNLYRSAGIIVLAASLYLLVYLIFTGSHILYRGQQEITFLSIPGFVMGFFALISRNVMFDVGNESLYIKYNSALITFFKKEYKYSNNWEILVIEDSKQPPMYTQQPMHGKLQSVSVIPWYLVKLISNNQEIIICKSRNKDQSNTIADAIHEKTNIKLDKHV